MAIPARSKSHVPDPRTPSTISAPSSGSGEGMSMMRIAIAGTGGLARIIGHYISEETSHQVVFLSRSPNPSLQAAGYQVLVVDYAQASTLHFALRGIDTVISTVTGANQIPLIKAAVQVRCRRFAPAEFESPPALAVPANHLLDRHRVLARQWLTHYKANIQSTIFVCGILYERFQPGGLARSGIGMTSGFSGEGEYMLDVARMAAEVPVYNSQGQPDVTIAMTAAQDVGRFVTKAVDLKIWPQECRMCGQRVKVKDLVGVVQVAVGRPFNPLTWHSPSSLTAELQTAIVAQDVPRQVRVHTLIATAEGRYDFVATNLNQAFPDVRVLGYREWFVRKWGLVGSVQQ